MLHDLPHASKYLLRDVAFFSCLALGLFLGWAPAMKACAEDGAEEQTPPEPVGPKDGLVVVSPDSFWFKFPDGKSKAPSPAQEEKAKQAKEEQARREAEEQARKRAAEERTRREAEEQARKQAAEERTRRQAEEQARKQAAEEQARKKAEEGRAAKRELPEEPIAQDVGVRKLLDIRAQDIGQVIARRGQVSVQLQRMKEGWQALMKSPKGEVLESADAKIAGDLVQALAQTEVDQAVSGDAYALDQAQATIYFKTKDGADGVLGLYKSKGKSALVLVGSGEEALLASPDSVPAVLSSFDSLMQKAEKALAESLPPQAEMLPGQEQTFLDISFVWIPQGAFDMGSSLSDKDVALIFGGDPEQYRDEQPSHTVTLTKGFWMGKYEVTNGEFDAFVTATRYETDAEREGWGRVWNGADWENRQGATWRNPGWTPEPGLPVVLVSWNDAAAYADWLSTHGNGHFRLPTEAEWEYACRAGGMGVFSFGNDPSLAGDYARYRGNGPAVGAPRPAPVGSMKPNDWGLYDMHGNVSEWCQDWYDDAYYAQSPPTDPQGPASGASRSLRGGSWYSLPRFFRCASRTRGIPGYRYVVLGFRVCRDE